jgi:hypothetical protein
MRFLREACVSRNAVLGTGSRPPRVIARSLIDLGRCHLPRDISHLLTDVVASRAGREGLKLLLDIDGGLAVEPGRTELGVICAVTGRAGQEKWRTEQWKTMPIENESSPV